MLITLGRVLPTTQVGGCRPGLMLLMLMWPSVIRVMFRSAHSVDAHVSVSVSGVAKPAGTVSEIEAKCKIQNNVMFWCIWVKFVFSWSLLVLLHFVIKCL